MKNPMNGGGSLYTKLGDVISISTLTVSHARSVPVTLMKAVLSITERQPLEVFKSNIQQEEELNRIVCPGIDNEDLQCFAKLPPRTTDEAHMDSYYLDVVYHKGEITTCSTTVRSQKCEQMFLNKNNHIMCDNCVQAKRLLLKKKKRHVNLKKRAFKKKTPLSKLSHSALKNALKISRQKAKSNEKELKMIREQLEKESVEVSETTHVALHKILQNFKSNDNLTKLFWQEQCKAFNRKSGGMRWHPMMIRLAVFIHSQSPAAYSSLKNTGILKLPCVSTLRDYTNYLHPSEGFKLEVFLELKRQTTSLEDHQRWVCLLHDEIAIKSGLVYDHRTGEMIGFIPEQFQTNKSEKDQNIASHALVFMVVGVTSNIKMSLGYFPTRTATAGEIFMHMWNAIGLLETCCNLKVIASTSDKAPSNIKLIKMHGGSHKTKNLFAKDRWLYFFSDAPHLMKTVRNNISSSGWGKNTRHLWNNGSEILWSHIKKIYDDDQTRELKRCPKLTADHIFLTPQSRMRVYLAAQVLSHTVGGVMKTFGCEESLETAKFILLMDKFFDCLNTRSVSEGHQKGNAYLLPYTSSNDERFQFLEEEFLVYLEEWKSSVRTRQGFSAGEKEKMFLSAQTYEGLKITVKSLIEATKYLLENGASMVLSNKFCQDPLEEHFGRHRCMGVRAENPTLWTYGYQENKLRIQRSLALSILPKGNIRGKRSANVVEIDNSPLQKIKRCRNN